MNCLQQGDSFVYEWPNIGGGAELVAVRQRPVSDLTGPIESCGGFSFDAHCEEYVTVPAVGGRTVVEIQPGPAYEPGLMTPMGATISVEHTGIRFRDLCTGEEVVLEQFEWSDYIESGLAVDPDGPVCAEFK